MPDKIFKWIGILTALILGLGLVLQPTLIGVLPVMLHYVLGIALIALGGYAAYKRI